MCYIATYDMSSTMYAVVYGESWEDVDYFSSFQKACACLIVHSLHMEDGFHPMLYGYGKEEHESQYTRTINMYGVKKLHELRRFDETLVKQNPLIALHLVESIF
jgi:hypothetical protein